VWQTNMTMTGWPCTSLGSQGAGGASLITATQVSSRGALAIN